MRFVVRVCLEACSRLVSTSTFFLSGTFDLFNVRCERNHRITLNPLVNVKKVDANGLFPLLDSDLDSGLDTDSCTMQILWERHLNLNLSQWKHVLHNTMWP